MITDEETEAGKAMTIEIVVASLPDRDRLVAELWWEDQRLAEINQEHGLSVELYPRQDGRPWRIPLTLLESGLTDARAKLGLAKG